MDTIYPCPNNGVTRLFIDVHCPKTKYVGKATAIDIV